MTYLLERSWPPVRRHSEAILDLRPNPYLGIDLEWQERTEVPTILGVSDGKNSVSVDYEAGEPYLKQIIARPGIKFVGHNLLGSDLFVLRERGINIPVEAVEDTVVRFWLTNAHLCKASKKYDEEERRGRGFMNLWTMASITTNHRCWKHCRGATCEGPCPNCNPFWYNGVDALAPVEALPKLLQWCALRGVEHLYPLHRDLMVVLAEMGRYGIMTDAKYIEKLRGEFQEIKNQLRETCERMGFNPESWQQVKGYFSKRHGLSLPNAQEETIRKYAGDYPQAEGLQLLLDYKEAGDGPDRWFKPREWSYREDAWDGFLHPDGTVHPRLGIFSSSGRLMCTGPNMQNVAKRRVNRKTGERIGVKIRKAVVAREGCYLMRGDYAQAENRTYLHLAGYRDLPEEDFHTWMAANIGITEDSPFALAEGGSREGAKTIVHAQDYLEGLVLCDPADLRHKKIRDEINFGSRLAFPDWTFKGKVVTFTGINLARRVFGKADWETRRTVLQATERYFARFPKIRELQKQITRQIKKEGAVRTPHGHYLLSYGYPEEQMKTACAVFGSQPVSHFTKLALLRLWKSPIVKPILQVHDELLFEVDKRIEPERAAREIREGMCFETKEIPGLKIPVDVSRGPSWAEQERIP